MGQRTILEKFLFLMIIIVVAILGTFFFLNRKNVNKALEKVEMITTMNADTYDMDLYVYKVENNIIYTSKYYYNKLYLEKNEVDYDEYNLDANVKYYLKTLTNTKENINDVKVSIDPISLEEFKYLLDNYSLLKVYIWFGEQDNCKNVLLYSPNNTKLELVNK